MNDRFTILTGHVLDRLREIPDASVNCVVTSPPYWGLRDYGCTGQIGLEPSPEEYVSKMVEIFREVRRVLRKDGTCWINLGDTYSASGAAGNRDGKQGTNQGSHDKPNRRAGIIGRKKKTLCAIPWRLAIALDDDGWYLRSDIIWSKPNPMPSSVRDRPSTSHEYIFLLTKSAKYWHDADAILEQSVWWASGPGIHTAIAHNVVRVPDHFNGSLPGRKNGPGQDRRSTKDRDRTLDRASGSFGRAPGWRQETPDAPTRNARTVWTIASQPYKKAHFATFPTEIPRRCILAGCPEGGTVLDPFLGSGTTVAVAIALGRRGIGIELNPEYVKLARERIAGVTPGMFMEVA